jgi:hypothetical protein
MPFHLSIMNPLATLVFCAATLHADLAATPMRQPGASLDTSIRNEADHAIRQAARWLADRQHPDGSWGESNRVELTALALFALSGARQPDQSGPSARAALWLNTTATNRLDRLGVHAWRLLALALVLPASPERIPFLRRLALQAPAGPQDAAAPADRALWHEALALAGLGPPPVPEPDAADRLARAAAAWPPPFADTRTTWLFARLVNRAANGMLLHGKEPIDWRKSVAGQLVSTQKKDPRGGGFWAADTPDGQLAETAYGILCLLEL